MEPDTVLTELTAKYRDFCSNGYLIPLEAFVEIPAPEQKIIRNAAMHLERRIDRFATWLNASKLLSEYPVLNLNPRNLEFFESEIEPQADLVGRLAFDRPDLLIELDELLRDVNLEGPPTRSEYDHIKAGLSRLIRQIANALADDDSQYFSIEIDRDEFDPEYLSSAEVTLSSKLFNPLAWINRASNVRSVITDRAVDKFPERIRGRLKETYDSYLVGHYFACICCCRSLLEFALLDRARPVLGYEPYVEEHGKKQALRLSQLIDSASEQQPDLVEGMHFVRDVANGLLHPPKGREINEFPPQEGMARKILNTTCHVVSVLYSKNYAQQCDEPDT